MKKKIESLLKGLVDGLTKFSHPVAKVIIVIRTVIWVITEVYRFLRGLGL